MISKTQQVRNLVSQGEYKKALQICKDWNYIDPTHRDILRLGYECLMYPKFYEQIGKDPAAAYENAVEILKEIYSS